jgi:hypothetical protein
MGEHAPERVGELMGMNATAKLWYGIVRDEFPEEFRTWVEEGDGSDEDRPFGELQVDGIHLDFIWAYDTLLGFGAIALHNWWGELDPIGIEELQVRIEKVKRVVDRVVDERRIAGPRNLVLTADYS